MNNTEYLEEFLDHFHFIYPNLNDTFYYACGDTERIALDGAGENDQKMLVEIYDEYGFAGIVAYVEKMGLGHKAAPLKELQNDKYLEAKAFLANWEYDGD